MRRREARTRRTERPSLNEALARTETIRRAAWPSPYGLLPRRHRPIGRRVAQEPRAFLRRYDPGSWPRSLATPSSIASGRSLSFLSTRTGLPSAGASSCTPPESVSTKAARFIAETNGPYAIGRTNRTRGSADMKPGTTDLDRGIGMNRPEKLDLRMPLVKLCDRFGRSARAEHRTNRGDAQ